MQEEEDSVLEVQSSSSSNNGCSSSEDDLDSPRYQKNIQRKEDRKRKKYLRDAGIIFLVNILFVIFFSIIYFFIRDEKNWNGLDQNSLWYDAFYFSFTTMTTIGYGDISPKSSLAKTFCIVQQLMVLFQLVNFLSSAAVKQSYRPPPKSWIRLRKYSHEKLLSSSDIAKLVSIANNRRRGTI